jgi:pentatricopeptide repeat protein
MKYRITMPNIMYFLSQQVSIVMNLMKESGIMPDEIMYGAAIDAHRRSGNSLLAIECLNEMQTKNIEPSAAHYNLVLRTLKAAGYAEKMYRMLIGLSAKEGSRINVNSYELTIEALLDIGMWKESLLIVKLMNQSVFQPSLETCTRVVEALERARQYKAVLAMYRLMDNYGYDFYENDVLNGIFKNIVNVAAKGIKADTAVPFAYDRFGKSRQGKQVEVLNVELSKSLEEEELSFTSDLSSTDGYEELDNLVSLTDLSDSQAEGKGMIKNNVIKKIKEQRNVAKSS